MTDLTVSDREGAARAGRPGLTRRRLLGAVAVGAALAASVAAGAPSSSAATASQLPVGKYAYVDVSVATMWRSPSSPRTIDRPALTNPVNVRGWITSMSNTSKLGLVGRVDSQALMGERVLVIAKSGSWVKVVAPDQPTPLDRRGYPGWIPAAQLTPKAPAKASYVATVTKKTTWLRTDDSAARAMTEISFGTRLPRIGYSGSYHRVVTPSGKVMRVYYKDVVVKSPSAPALTKSATSLVRTAQMFHGLPYLWGGRSGFGFDCSGLFSMDFKVHGRVIPRDADAQARAGSWANPARPAVGDLLFFARDGRVHHVGMYAGSGTMVHAPRTGLPVQTILRPASYSARRF